MEHVYGAVADLRERHAELRAPRLTWDGMRRVLNREGVLVASVPLGRPAKLVIYEGVGVMLLDSARPARHLWYCAHELAHWKLHVQDDLTEHDGLCYHMDDLTGDDPREHEADLFADLLMYGPERSVDG